MKKKLPVTILMGTMLSAAVITGCGASSQNADTKAGTEAVTEAESVAATETTAETEAETVTEADAAAEKGQSVIKPVYPLETAQDALADGGYSVSFTADDLVKTDDGYELTAEVYGHDQYTPEDIDSLTKGSIIQYCNQEITVDEVEKGDDAGSVTINGGVENDGISLMENDGLYRAVAATDDYSVYYSIGKVTIPLAEDATLEDQAGSEPGAEASVAELKDIPAAIENSELPFNAGNTVITVRQEQIVQIIRYWTP